MVMTESYSMTAADISSLLQSALRTHQSLRDSFELKSRLTCMLPNGSSKWWDSYFTESEHRNKAKGRAKFCIFKGSATQRRTKTCTSIDWQELNISLEPLVSYENIMFLNHSIHSVMFGFFFFVFLLGLLWITWYLGTKGHLMMLEILHVIRYRTPGTQKKKKKNRQETFFSKDFPKCFRATTSMNLTS